MPQFRYVPILRWKEGEEGALSHLVQNQKADVCPLIILMNEQYKDKKATKKKPAVLAAVAFVDRIIACWGTQPFYLDASDIPTPANGSHPIAAIAAVAHSRGVALIPATSLGVPSGYAQAVHSITQNLSTGIALRVELHEATNAASWVNGWPISLAQTDLIVDLQDTAPTVLGLGSVLQAAFASLHMGMIWRTVTIAGTSMPPNFSTLSQGLHIIPRSEYLIWQNIHAGLPYRLDYGDYATPPIAEPPSGIRYGFPINVRYTLVDSFLICKGVRTTGVGSVLQATQLRAHASDIKNHPNRYYLNGCWADDEIDQIAVGKSPQGLGYWVTIGVNRHIAITRHMIP